MSRLIWFEDAGEGRKAGKVLYKPIKTK